MQIDHKVEGSKVGLYVDGELYRRFETSLWKLRSQKKAEQCHTKAELDQLIAQEEVQLGYRCALQRLSRQAVMVDKLRDLLIKRGVSPQAAEQIILLLQEKGYLEQRHELMERAIHSLLRRGKGPRQMVAWLQRQNISRQDAEEAVARHRDDEALAAKLRSYLERDRHQLNDPKVRRRLYQRYLQRGFDGQLIDRVFAQLSSF